MLVVKLILVIIIASIVNNLCVRKILYDGYLKISRNRLDLFMSAVSLTHVGVLNLFMWGNREFREVMSTIHPSQIWASVFSYFLFLMFNFSNFMLITDLTKNTRVRNRSDEEQT